MNWSPDELTLLDEMDEMRIAGRRQDGSHRKAVIVWMVRLGDGIYTRSVNGTNAAWYRGTQIRHEGFVSAAELQREVTFIDIDSGDPINDQLDAAYRSKYRRYSAPVKSITSSVARSTTLKVVPQP